ncbi:MAG TPA: hypothetical protein VH274_05300 [Mycobacteriales bacterium]|jgi:hypothetical protein|nr:hypothetical protein [Mycobacteriales bacterium]
MTRRLVLAICLLGTIGGAAGTALADQPVRHKPHQVCVVFYQDNGTTQDYCVDWSAAQQH